MSRLTKILLCVMLAGLFVGGIGVADAIKVWKNDISDTEKIEVGSLEKGDLYEGNIAASIDMVAEQTTTSTYGFMPVSKTTSPYYLIENENCYMLICVTDVDKQEEFKELTTQTRGYMYGGYDKLPDGVNVTAQVVEMPDDAKKYLKEYCDQWGMPETEYAAIVEDAYCLKTVRFSGMKYAPLIGFGLALICAVILIIRKAKAPKIVNL